MDTSNASRNSSESPHSERKKVERVTLRVTTALLFLVTCIVFLPFWPWMTLALWFADLGKPLLLRATKLTGGRRRAAASMTLLLMTLVGVPLIAVTVSVVGDGRELAQAALRSPSGKAALQTLVSPDHSSLPELAEIDWRALGQHLSTHLEQAWGILNRVAGALGYMLFGLLVFFISTYAFLVYGEPLYIWLEEQMPISRRHLRRMADAFLETGRGLLIGVGLTGLVQALVATIAYLALGVPRALVLGFLTFIASLIPSVGAALVWVPITLGLTLSGRSTQAIILGLIGVLLISTIDNLLRPMLTRWGKLNMPLLLLFFSMLGGVAVIGAWGFILGPLVVRLAMEAAVLSKETFRE